MSKNDAETEFFSNDRARLHYDVVCSCHTQQGYPEMERILARLACPIETLMFGVEL